MSESQGGAGRREVAWRLFAAEFDDADFSYAESDEERAPNYVVTPTGARVNRLFAVGVLTAVETVSEDYLRARVVDPTGPFVVYAGQYQPEALAFLERAETPAFVAVTGKARTYQPDDSDQVFTSVRPERMSEVDADTRDRWVVDTAEQTLDRVARAAEAKETGLAGDDLRAALEAHGVPEGLASGIPVALDHYGTTGDYLAAVRRTAIESTRVVTGEQDEATSLTTAPDAGGDDPIPDLVERSIDLDAVDTGTTEERADEGEDESAESTDATTDPGSAVGTAESSGSPTVDDSDHGEPASEGSTARESDVTASDTATATEEVEETERAETGSTEPPETTAGSTEATERDTRVDDESDDVGDFDAEFELDDEEREEIAEEYGTEFQSGTEVDEPGAADIETPDPESQDAEPAATESGSDSTAPESGQEEADTTPTASEPGTEPADAADADDAVEPSDADDVDLEDAVLDAMGDLDEGDGAPRDDVIAAVVDRTGADTGAVQDAVQDALMDGRCYEPDDETLKPI